MRVVRGEGPANARVMLVGEAPGREEGAKGRPFVGKSGKLLTRYMDRVGLRRDECYITNLVKVWPGEGNPDPTPEQIEEWSPTLLAEIRTVKPAIIATLGRYSTRFLLGEPDADMDTYNGLVMKTPHGWVVPVYHPASGLHNPVLSGRCFWGLRQVSRVLKTFEHPAVKALRWVEALGPERFDLQPIDKKRRVVTRVLDNPGVDTEGSADKPYCLSYSFGGPSGVVVPAKHADRVKFDGSIILHNALHDLRVLRAMGHEVHSFTDNMVLAYVLQTEPQSLKGLAFRYLGRRRREYREVVGPAHRTAALEWVKRAQTVPSWPAPEETLVPDPDTGKLRIYAPQPVPTRLKSLVTSVSKETHYDPSKWWDALPEGHRKALAGAVGAFPVASLDLVPEKEAVTYAGGDAADTANLAPVLWARVEQAGLADVARLDMAVLPMADRMMSHGIRLDTGKLAEVDGILRDRRDALVARLKGFAGRSFNPASSAQVADLLFSRIGLKPGRKTRGGTRYTTDDRTIEPLRGSHEAVDWMLDFREVDKLLTTYTGPLGTRVRDDGRVHGRIKPTTTATGRWAMEEPNLQNIPTRSDYGKLIRECFIADPGWMLLSVDLSQIELRMMAHESEDPRMVQAFRADEDLHALTASLLFKVPLSKVSVAQRYIAKTINFATMYGISARALLAQLKMAGITEYTETDCSRIIKEWFLVYSAVARYLASKHAEARRYGFVRDWLGRLRYVPNVYADDEQLRAAAEREAGNHPIQGGAQEVIKTGMRDVWPWIYGRQDIRPLLQVHDELIFEVKTKTAKGWGQEIQGVLESAVPLRVPVKSSCAIADNWGSLE